MTPASSSRTRDVILELAETLADVAAADTEYRSVYLSRARALLASVVSRAALEAIRGERGRLGGLREEARRALETGDWHRVRKLALALRDADRRVAESEGVFRVAEHVYDADTGIARDALPAYTVSPLSTDALRSVQARTVRHLERLAASDAAWHPFYATRRDAVAALSMENRAEPAGAAEEAMWEQARQALRAGRWDALASLAEGLGGGRDPATLGCACGTLAEEPQTPDVGPPATELAARAGLFPTPLEARDDLRAFLSCRCARAPRLSTRALGEVDAGERSTTCGCHHRCPGLEERLRETLDVLKHRAFLSSLGTRYLPTFAAAVVLLETFPESEAERGPLLEELRLPRRLGLSRLEIEQALAMRGSDVVRDLGLDPLDHVLVPAPFDVYLRAAAHLGWGRRPHWTHLDGYQVLRGWRLRALVGGNARYGGAADLCTIARDDARDDVLVRFCVMSRRHLRGRVDGPAGNEP